MQYFNTIKIEVTTCLKHIIINLSPLVTSTVICSKAVVLLLFIRCCCFVGSLSDYVVLCVLCCFAIIAEDGRAGYLTVIF